MKTLLSIMLTALFRAATAQADAPMHYEPNDKLVYLPVQVNGSRTLWFTLDSGARHTVIDAAAAKALKLRIFSTDNVAGAGKGDVAMQHAADIDVSIGATHLRVRDPWIIDLSKIEGKHIDGLIGADFFAAFAVRIDPLAHTIAFYPQSTFRYRSNGAALPMAFIDNRMFVDLKLSLSNGVTAVHRVRIDTGSDDAVSDDLVKQSPERRKSQQGVGLGQPYVDYSGVLDRVQIGPYTIRHSWGASNSAPAVGMEILRRFTMTFEAARNVLHLEPNASLADPVPTPR